MIKKLKSPSNKINLKFKLTSQARSVHGDREYIRPKGHDRYALGLLLEGSYKKSKEYFDWIVDVVTRLKKGFNFISYRFNYWYTETLPRNLVWFLSLHLKARRLLFLLPRMEYVDRLIIWWSLRRCVGYFFLRAPIKLMLLVIRWVIAPIIEWFKSGRASNDIWRVLVLVTLTWLTYNVLFNDLIGRIRYEDPGYTFERANSRFARYIRGLERITMYSPSEEDREAADDWRRYIMEPWLDRELDRRSSFNYIIFNVYPMFCLVMFRILWYRLYWFLPRERTELAPRPYPTSQTEAYIGMNFGELMDQTLWLFNNACFMSWWVSIMRWNSLPEGRWRRFEIAAIISLYRSPNSQKFRIGWDDWNYRTRWPDVCVWFKQNFISRYRRWRFMPPEFEIWSPFISYKPFTFRSHLYGNLRPYERYFFYRWYMWLRSFIYYDVIEYEHNQGYCYHYARMNSLFWSTRMYEGYNRAWQCSPFDDFNRRRSFIDHVNTEGKVYWVEFESAHENLNPFAHRMMAHGKFCWLSHRNGIEEGLTQPFVLVMWYHRLFRRTCFKEGIPFDYWDWAPHDFLKRCLNDPACWFYFFGLWAKYPKLKARYQLENDPFFFAWVLGRPTRRHSVLYATSKDHRPNFTIDGRPYHPWVYSPVYTYIDYFNDELAVRASHLGMSGPFVCGDFIDTLMTK